MSATDPKEEDIDVVSTTQASDDQNASLMWSENNIGPMRLHPGIWDGEADFTQRHTRAGEVPKYDRLTQDDEQLEELLAGADPKVNFAGRFSIAMMSCGAGCVSFWLVDRHKGGAISFPAGGFGNQIPTDFETTADSRILGVVYDVFGYPDKNCAAQRFEWRSDEFTALDDASPTPCF